MGNKQTRTSYTALLGSLLSISSISTAVVSAAKPDLLLPTALTSVEDVEYLCCPRGRRRRLKVSLKTPLLLPPSPSSEPGSEVLPRRPLVESTSPSFKARTVPKRLKSALPSNVVQIHQKIKRTIVTSTTPTGSLAHNSLLNSRASRPKAVINAAVLSVNDVSPTVHPTITDSSRLTPRVVTNMAGCTGLREFQTRGHCDDDDFGDNYPITEETAVAVSEGTGVRDQRRKLTTSSAASCGLVLCCRSNKRPVTTLPTDAMMER